MRPVSLTKVQSNTIEARLKWCEEMIANICRASQVDSPVQTDKKNKSTFLKAASNLSDVADKAMAFSNIKQAASESATGVVELATAEETVTGTSKELATHPAGVKAAINALAETINEAIGDLLAAAQNLADVEDPAQAFANIKQKATEAATGVVELATVAEICAATAGELAITAASIKAASAHVTLTYNSSLALDWNGFVNAEVQLEGNCEIGNPTNGQPGTWRTIVVKGNNSTARTVTFDDQYGGELPEITDVTSSKWYEIIIRCVSANHFLVAARDASPPS